MSNFDFSKLPTETIDKAYEDAIHPIATEIGKTGELLMRTIRAALSPLKTWTLEKELKENQVEEELRKSLSSVDPNKIVPPNSYVAVPALQAISYSMSSKELCDLYANLLAKSMVSDTKETVHPAFVEIIKQLSPNDALVFKIISVQKAVPVANLSILMLQKGLHIVGNTPEERIFFDLVSNIVIPSVSEEQVRISLDNLLRIGLIQMNDFELKDDTSYSFVKSSEVYSEISEEFHRLNAEKPTAERIHIYKKCLSTTSLGKLFRSVCIDGF